MILNRDIMWRVLELLELYNDGVWQLRMNQIGHSVKTSVVTLVMSIHAQSHCSLCHNHL